MGINPVSEPEGDIARLIEMHDNTVGQPLCTPYDEAYCQLALQCLPELLETHRRQGRIYCFGVIQKCRQQTNGTWQDLDIALLGTNSVIRCEGQDYHTGDSVHVEISLRARWNPQPEMTGDDISA